jgi:hypothetical protein
LNFFVDKISSIGYNKNNFFDVAEKTGWNIWCVIVIQDKGRKFLDRW